MIKDEFQKAVGAATPDLLEALRCACNYIDKLGGTSPPIAPCSPAPPKS